MTIGFKELTDHKEISLVIRKIDSKAVGSDREYFIDTFANQGPRFKSTSNDLRIFVFYSNKKDAFNPKHRPACIITRLEPRDVLVVCVLDAGDLNKTGEVMKWLGFFCDDYSKVRFHVHDDRVKLLARSAGYQVEFVESIYLATRKGDN